MHALVQVRAADGVRISIEHRRAESPRGAVVCLHAMMTDSRYFGIRREGSFASTLVANGFDVFAPDFRGHGRSDLRAGRDDWSFDDLVELDLPVIVETAAATSRCAPSELVILGHSLGGLVTCAALGIGAIPSPKLVVLPATAVWLLGPRGDLRRRALMALYRNITAVLGHAPIRALRIGSADEAATYVKQLTGWTRAARWTSLRGVDYLAALRTIETPMLPFVGAGDWMCTPSDARGFVASIRNAAPTRIVGKQFGDAIDADHFSLFTNSALEPLWRDLLDRF